MTRFRLATAADAERANSALARLSSALGDAHRSTPEDLLTAGFGDTPAFRLMLAEEGETLLAVALYSPCYSTMRGRAGVYLADLWVTDERRGERLGPRLMGAVMRDAGAAWGARFLKLCVHNDNPRARAFYDRIGFTANDYQTEMYLDEAGCAALDGV